MKLPAAIEVARAKARAFCKEIFTHPRDIAKDLGIIQDGNPQPTWVTVGRTTSFQCGTSTITLAGSVPRKVIINESKAGQTISALWHVGADQSMLQTLLQKLGRFQRQELLKANTWMVGWLSDLCHLRRFECH
jgi:hypothetical protein